MRQRDADVLRSVGKELRRSFEWAFDQLQIPPAERKYLYKSDEIRSCARRLMADGKFCWDRIGIDFYLLDFPQIKLRNFVLSLPQGRNFFRHGRGQPKHGRCFVGCRYDDEYHKLQAVLKGILGHYGYEVPPPITGAGQILDSIIDQLNSPDIAFALFDNRATATKPNVYIELGIAYTLDKPLMLFQHRKTVLPSDLGGFSAFRYLDYQDLARQLSLHLPRFLHEESIPPPWQEV